MAEILVTPGTPLVWAAADYAANSGKPARTTSPTTLALDMDGLLNGQAREGVKADLGASFAHAWAIELDVETGSAPAAGVTAEVYFGYSQSSTAANANPGDLTGADADYAGINSNEVETLRGGFDGPYVLTLADDSGASDQRGFIGKIYPSQRYIIPVCLNLSGVTLVADGVEMYLALHPLPWDTQ